MKNILFITTNNLATNPRCLKEVTLAVEQGFDVTVIKFKFKGWSEKFEDEIESSLPNVNFHNINVTGIPVIPWILSEIYEKAFYYLSYLIKGNIQVAACALDKRSLLILKALKQLKTKPNLIIAHNPGAFWPAFVIAKKSIIPFAIDIEDYHPGEWQNEKQKRNLLLLMQCILSRACYLSFASPLIKKYVIEKIPALPESVIVNNCFSRDEFQLTKAPHDGKLQFVWYSQNISYGRGIEKVLCSLSKFCEKLRVTLIGNLSPAFEGYLSTYKHFVTIISSLPQKELHRKLQEFDIGLAIEDSRVDFNRKICLTNKIWSYFQSGLFILASDTKAQKQFLIEHPDNGKLFNINLEASLTEAIQFIIDNKEEIRFKKDERFRNSLPYSWEVEKQKLLRLWKDLAKAEM